MLESLAAVGSTTLLRSTENGREHAIVSRPAAAAVVAVRPSTTRPGEYEVLLVRQHRPAAGGIITEIPAGKLDAGEAPQQAAERELAEETGLRAARWHALAEHVLPSPGYTDEKIHIFLAREFADVPRRADDAHIQLNWHPLPDLLDGAGNALTDAKTLIGLFLVHDYLRQEQEEHEEPETDTARDAFEHERQQQRAGLDEALEIVNAMSLQLRDDIATTRPGLPRRTCEQARTTVRSVIDTLEEHRIQHYGQRSAITDQTPDELHADDARLADDEQP